MRLIPADPDVRTIIARIEDGDLDLQPEFQRGEVWSEAKKRRLIDSILRNWHVPPVHVVEVPGSNIQEVLDGQQRLAAIRDFAAGQIRIDGNTEPADFNIAKLDGMTYRQLPSEWRRRFDQFTIRVISITDYAAGEPAELFYRLNQPAALTSAEQRNAFFGKARSQVRGLVQELQDRGVDKDFIGFSNARMAYDDVIARFCFYLEAGTLAAKVSAQALASVYRGDDGFSWPTVDAANTTVNLFAEARAHVVGPVRFNKATFFSWLWFANVAHSQSSRELTGFRLGQFVDFFEQRRLAVVTRAREFMLDGDNQDDRTLAGLILIYNDRSTSRVSDTSSILARDIVLWAGFDRFAQVSGLAYPLTQQLRDWRRAVSGPDGEDPYSVLDKLVDTWGRPR